MLEEIRAAKRFVFLEFFLIDEGLMWGRVLEALYERALSGVEVRVMYDGMCELELLSRDYPARLKTLHIRAKAFSPVHAFVSTHYNYRDHRKILVIDGHTAFTGGVNLADEYINEIHPFGRWKDTAVRVKGDAARSFTLMFLQQWNLTEKAQVPPLGEYLTPERLYDHAACKIPQEEGYVIPYGNNPLSDDKVAEHVYMDILNRADAYVHIMTPYLILDGEMETALKLAAMRGVDVKLILPGIPDKKIPYALAKSHYRSLLEAGVKLYEYTPGFVHAKVFVSDDKKAVVGTINLDYRSLYHHFECGVYLYETPCIADIEADFAKTLAECREATLATLRKEPFGRWLIGAVMKVFAPLL